MSVRPTTTPPRSPRQAPSSTTNFDRSPHLLDALQPEHGPVLVVVDRPRTIGALVIVVPQDLNIEVTYLPGEIKRRVADLHQG